MLSCETCKLFRNNYCEEHLWMFASKLYLETLKQVFSRRFCELFKNNYFVEDLQTAVSETPVRGSLFNKVASLTYWTHLTVLERDSSTVNFVKFLGKLFCRTPPSNHFSHDVVIFSFLQISEVCSLKSICLEEQGY